MASEQELQAYYQAHIKLIGENWVDFEAEHRNMTIQQIDAKYQHLIDLSRKMDNP